MSWNKPKSKKSGAAAEPVVLDSRFRRCDHCSVGDLGFGQPRLGTVLISETVQLIPEPVRQENGKMERPANIDIGRVTRCPNEASGKMRYDATAQAKVRACTRPPVFKPYPAFNTLGIEQGTIYGLLRACPGSPAFYLDELKSGSMRTYPTPDSLAELMRPRFNPVPEPAPAPQRAQEVMF